MKTNKKLTTGATIMKKALSHIVLCLALITLTSCASLDTNQKQGTAVGTGVGAGLGAILGQAIGGSTEATLIGAGIGAVVGGVAGNQVGKYMDNQEQELRNVMAASDAASIRRSQDVLVATFKGETFFNHDSAMLLPGGHAEISRIAGVLNKYNQTQIEVGGHTDSSGSEVYNQQLSLRRAESVKNTMVQQGINPTRIRTVGYGEGQPISSSAAANRRVEITIVPITS
jgi:outer membrane protein OmpA-like peptidoglycan-associated protein